MLFMETSAKLNYQVSEIFNTVGELRPLHRSVRARCYASTLGLTSGVLGAGRGMRKTNRECLVRVLGGALQYTSLFSTAQELLQRAGDTGSSRPQEGEAVALNQEPPIRQRQCCAR